MLQAEVEHLRRNVAELRDALAGAARALGSVNRARRVSDPVRIAEASDQLRVLLAIPGDRPGAAETGPVTQLDDQLREVLAVLEGGGAA